MTSTLTPEQRERDWLQEMWDIVSPYVQHLESCPFGRDTPDGEYCNCCLADMKQRLRELKRQAKA